MLPALRNLACLCLLALGVAGHAQASDSRLPALATSDVWRKLLHYEPDGFSASHARSHVEDPRFFLAPDGGRRPLAELEATVQAYYTPVQDANRHPRCQFVARYRWLEAEQVVDPRAVEPLVCTEYQQWRTQIEADSLVLVYASAHLNSPSSMYGHTLFRIDPPADAQRSDWLSWGVSFGANIPKDEATVIYAYKGIAGGYPGLFNVQPFFEKIEQYNKMENRDLWEYRLNLTHAELDRLVEHLWELKDIRFTYFFFDENCAYRLLELLEYARPSAQLTSRFIGTTIPVDTVRVIRDAGFIEQTDYRPSAETLLQARLKTLSRQERALANAVMRGEREVKDPAVLALPPESRYAVYDMAYRALRYRERKQARDPLLAQRSLALLREINTLSAVRHEAPLPRPPQPDSGHETAMLGASAGVVSRDSEEHDGHTTFSDLELRLSFHDLLDPSPGYLPGAAINMGRFVARAGEGGDLQLQVFDVVDIQSITPLNRFYTPWSWRARIGFERVPTADGDPLVPHAGAGFGYSGRPASSVMAYAMLTGRAEYNEVFADNWQAGVGSTAGLLWFNRLGIAGVRWEQTEFFNGYDRHGWQLAQDVVLAKDLALRFSYEQQHAPQVESDTVQLGLRYFY